MCKKINYKTCNVRIDKCMRNIIKFLNNAGIKTCASCCGHGKYPMSIVVEWHDDCSREIVSNKIIYRKRRFYKRDKQGYYYIKELIKEVK